VSRDGQQEDQTPRIGLPATCLCPYACACIPAAELAPTFISAVSKLNTHLRQQQQQQQQQQEQEQEQQPTPLAQRQQEELAVLAAGLLNMFNSFAHLFSTTGVLHVLPTMGSAAELALLVLTGPQGGLAPNTDNLAFEAARELAATTIFAVGSSVMAWAHSGGQPGSVRVAAAPEEAVMVSDTVQQAVILHFAVLVPAARRKQRQRQRAMNASSSNASSSSSWAPAAAKRLLQHLGFPLGMVQQYASVVCRASQLAAEPLIHQVENGLSYMQSAIEARVAALQQPDSQWVARFSGAMAAAAAAAAAAATADPSPERSVTLAAFQHAVCPAVHPLQLVQLVLDAIHVMGFTQAKLTADTVAISFVARLLTFAQTQVIFVGVPATEASVWQGYAKSCVESIWLGLGKQLQQASGVAEAELEENAHDAQVTSASAATAAEVDDGSATPAWQWSAGLRGGATLQLPADAVGRLQLVWSTYSRCLFGAIGLYQGEV
jgi:hypothetical protein